MSVLSRWTSKLSSRQKLLAAARKRKDSKAIAERLKQVAQAKKIVARHRKLDRLVAFDGCPVPYGIAVLLADLRRRGVHFSVQSCDRRTTHLLHELGKSSQAELYDGFVHHRPGYLPANPPGFSSHERRSDGVAYPARLRGSVLPYWCTGIDINDAAVDDVIRGLWKHYGVIAWRPYPSGSEYHHINLKRDPTKAVRRVLAAR